MQSALDYETYPYRPTLEDLARQEYERRQREQERYAPSGAPAPMQPPEYVVAQAPIPPPLRANEMPVGPDPRASVTSALDLQEPRANFEMQAQQGAPVSERYVPRSGAVPPMYPSPPAQYGPIPSGEVAYAPVPLGPTDQQLPPPMPLGMPTRTGRQPDPSQVPSDRPPLTPSEPAKEGDIIWTTDKGLHRAKGGETSGFNLGDITFNLEKGLHRRSSAVGAESVTSSTAAATGAVVEAAIPPAGAPAAPAVLTPGGAVQTGAPRPAEEEEKPIPRKGARPAQAAVAERGEFPEIVPKAVIDPQYLVRLEQSNPALHDAIVSAASKAGVGSWDYANLIYGVTKGDPNFRDKDGRMGIAGLKPEDVAKYQRAYPELFRDERGNPISPMDPATNLLLGAQKFRELRDRYGANTANSIAAYYLDPDKVDHTATLTPAEQRQAIGDDGYRVVRQAIGGPDAEKGEAKALQLNPAGTLTAPRVIEAATQAARTGDTRGFFSVMADGLPRGMSSTDGWKHVEALGVGAMLMRGNVDGAQKVRELMFQMSHVGANQALMRAHAMLEGNDLVGAAQQLALAYWATPDGGMARISVTPQGLVGQRYNEATGTKVGAPFRITKETVAAMLNQTRDPQTFLKTMQASQKHNADIEHKHAETAHKRVETVEKTALLPSKIRLQEAQAGYYEERGELEQYRSDNAADVRLLELRRKLLANPGDEKAQAALRNHLDTAQHIYFPTSDPATGPIPITPEVEKQRQVWRDMLQINHNLDHGRAANIAKGLTSGRFGLAAGAGGGAVVTENGRPTGILLPPSAVELLRKRPPTPTPASPIGAKAVPPT